MGSVIIVPETLLQMISLWAAELAEEIIIIKYVLKS